MKPYEFTRIYNPRMGKFVYRHKGSGIIIDNIFKPMKKVAATMTKSVLKPLAKKALKSGIEHTGKKIGEKSGDLIMKRLGSLGSKKKSKAKTVRFTEPKESTDILVNRLISGSGK